MLRIVPHTVPRVGRLYEHFPDGFEVHLLPSSFLFSLLLVSLEQSDLNWKTTDRMEPASDLGSWPMILVLPSLPRVPPHLSDQALFCNTVAPYRIAYRSTLRNAGISLIPELGCVTGIRPVQVSTNSVPKED